MGMHLSRQIRALFAAVGIAVGGGACSERDTDWPPPVRDAEARAARDAARRAVEQFDGWTEVAYVVKRRGDGWRVEAWKIVHPGAKGRNRCVPWESRGISVDAALRVTAYENRR